MAPSGSVGYARSQAPLEEPVVAGEHPHEVRVEQREPGNLGQGRTACRPEGDERLVQDGRDGASWVARPRCCFRHYCQGFARPCRPGRSQDGCSGPACGGFVQRSGGLGIDPQTETRPAQLQSFVDVQREVHSGELEVLGPPQPTRALGQLPPAT